jgi:prepilin-type N-terminal cleavage/methylation domain-containing protein
MQKLKKRGGFTLVELIVVLVILAILAALLIPALTGYIDKSKRDQVVAETRMLHEAVQTVASEAYGSSEWKTANIFTIASKSGRQVTNAEVSEQKYPAYSDRYNEIVKLAEIPSLENDAGGSFVAVVDPNGSVYCLLYNTGRGLLGAYYRDKGEYKVYDKQKNIENYNKYYQTYLNFVISDTLLYSKDDLNRPWSPYVVDATLNS